MLQFVQLARYTSWSIINLVSITSSSNNLWKNYDQWGQNLLTAYCVQLWTCITYHMFAKVDVITQANTIYHLTWWSSATYIAYLQPFGGTSSIHSLKWPFVLVAPVPNTECVMVNSCCKLRAGLWSNKTSQNVLIGQQIMTVIVHTSIHFVNLHMATFCWLIWHS